MYIVIVISRYKRQSLRRLYLTNLDLNIERMEIPAFYIFTMCLDKHRPRYH